ncbi:MAG: LysR family transcriptional regulator [Alphaproteobacteria bacterium]|nr:LysR family transcriptional regulator [Alphaproteobacteria bacterium]
MDRLAELEVFAAVAGQGSFTGAARVLQLPRSTVTARIQALEARLGVRLLHRTTRRVSLTVDGRAALRDVQRILDDLRDLHDLGAASAEPRGRIRVDAPSAAARHVIAPALPELLARYPELEVHLGSTDRPVDVLAEGVDCVIRGGEVFDPSLVGRRLARFEVLTCAAPSYLAAHGVPASPHDLDHHVFVAFLSPRSGRPYDPDFTIDGELVAVPARHRVACNDSDTWLTAGLAGAGLLQVPLTRHVLGHLRDGRLVPVLERWPAGELPVSVLWPRQRLPARVRVFVDWVVALYEEEARIVSTWRSAGYDGA